MQVVLVEHMEEYPTRWLVAEYVEAWREAERAGLEFMVTGVRDPRLQSLLSRMGVPWSWEHSWQVYDRPGTIVLDLWADRDLDPLEAEVAEAFVIGGIMGDYPPRMRGVLLTSMFDWSSRRRLGERQMSIHTAAWAVAQVIHGARVEDLPLCENAVIRMGGGLFEAEIRLPFSYPCGADGKPRVPESIARILERGVVWDEEVTLA